MDKAKGKLQSNETAPKADTDRPAESKPAADSTPAETKPAADSKPDAKPAVVAPASGNSAHAANPGFADSHTFSPQPIGVSSMDQSNEFLPPQTLGQQQMAAPAAAAGPEVCPFIAIVCGCCFH